MMPVIDSRTAIAGAVGTSRIQGLAPPAGLTALPRSRVRCITFGRACFAGAGDRIRQRFLQSIPFRAQTPAREE